MGTPGRSIGRELGPGFFLTHSINRPKKTHWRSATCAEVGCSRQAHGFTATIDERTDLGMGQAYYIRAQSGRRFSEARQADGTTLFTFVAGQNCFSQHELPLDRPELYVVRGGDWRGDPRNQRTVMPRPELWVEHMEEHLDTLRKEREG